MSSFLSIFWLILVVFSIIFAFVNIKIAFAIFLISCIFLYFYLKTPEAKQMIKQQKEEENRQKEVAKQKKVELANLRNNLESNISDLSANPVNSEILSNTLEVVRNLPKDELKPIVNTVIIPLLKIFPLDEKIRSLVFSFAQKVVNKFDFNSPVSSQVFYEAALDVLQENPEEMSLKKYALEVGRWHYASSRSDGKVTVYDEQSIQNDILVRTK